MTPRSHDGGSEALRFFLMPVPPLSKRERASRLLGQPVLAPLRGRRAALRILAYHRIVAPPWDDFRFDEQIISATPEAFEAQMRFVAKNFEVVGFADLEKCEIEGKPWPSRALIVTFDDGYRDNYTLAWPILRELKLPATIFLTTGHIGAQKLFWWDAIAFAFNTSDLPSVEVPELGQEPFPLATPAQKRAAIDAALSYSKSVSDAQRRDFVARLPALLEVNLDENVARGMHINWDEVREMARGGVEFGGHTVTHPILSRVDAEQLEFETAHCKAEIERETGQNVLAFAYPAGTRQRRDPAARAGVEASGYRFAVAYDQGVEQHPDRFAMPRLHVDRDQSLSLFRANLLFPGLMLR